MAKLAASAANAVAFPSNGSIRSDPAYSLTLFSQRSSAESLQIES
jgi:hypothetical protein